MLVYQRVFNIAMENGPFVEALWRFTDLPIQNGDFFHSYVSHNQTVYRSGWIVTYCNMIILGNRFFGISWGLITGHAAGTNWLEVTEENGG